MYWISSHGETTGGDLPPLGLGMWLTTPHHKEKQVNYDWMDSLYKQPKWQNMDMRFGTWHIRTLYGGGGDSLMTFSRELSRYRLDLVGVQEVRWEGNGTVPLGEYTFSMVRKMRTFNCVQVFLYIRESYHCYQLHTKCYQISFYHSYIHT
jgi:hypothetical protein